MNFKNLISIIDAIDEHSQDRFEALKLRVGDKPQHYLNQIDKCQGDKKLLRVQTFYELATKEGLTETAKAIKSHFPDIYASEDQINADRAAEAEAKEKERAEAEAKAAEAESQKAINILKSNAEKTKRSACYGFDDSKVHDLQEELYKELVPSSGVAPTEAGELLRAYNDLMYRYYNDGDWIEWGARLFGYGFDSSFSPRSVSNMKYLVSHGAAQISFFLDHYSDDRSKFEAATERMLLNQIIKNKLYEVPNATDSRKYWSRGGN